jgi:hypothetical protein
MTRTEQQELDRLVQFPFGSLANAVLFLLEAEYVEQDEIEANRATLEYLQRAIELALEPKGE